MLVKRSTDWKDIEVEKRHHNTFLNRNDWYVLIGVVLFFIVAFLWLLYIVKHWYEN